MLLSLRENGLTSLFKEVRVFKAFSSFSGEAPEHQIFSEKPESPESASSSLGTPIWEWSGQGSELFSVLFRSRPGKPNQRKGQNEKFMNFAHFCEFWCVSLGKQARFTLNFCSGTPLRKVHELAFLWFGLPGPLLISIWRTYSQARLLKHPAHQQHCNQNQSSVHYIILMYRVHA